MKKPILEVVEIYGGTSPDSGRKASRNRPPDFAALISEVMNAVARRATYTHHAELLYSLVEGQFKEPNYFFLPYPNFWLSNEVALGGGLSDVYRRTHRQRVSEFLGTVDKIVELKKRITQLENQELNNG